MKKLLAILILVFTLQTPSQADDIRDFQIEGMSVGDSALDHFSEKKLLKNKENWFKNDKYTLVNQLKKPTFKIYDVIQLVFKTNDSKKIISGIEGIIFYKDDIKTCLKQLDVVSKDVETLFINVKNFGKKTYKHSYDKTGESTVTDVIYEFDSKDKISIACQDWSKKFKYSDQLRIQIRTKDYSRFLLEDAY